MQTPAETFITRALNVILNDKEIRKKHNKQLKKSCQHALVQLTTVHNLHNKSSVLLEKEDFLTPFELACESKSSKIVIPALDCMQKLIAYGHIQNTLKTSSGKRFIDQFVDSICCCCQDFQTDEGIQLQVIKALLTVMTNQFVEVHDNYVLQVFGTCFNICVASKNNVNRAIAKASLDQILNILFQRMEAALSEVIAQSDTVSKRKVTGKNDSNELANESVSSVHVVQSIIESIICDVVDLSESLTAAVSVENAKEEEEEVKGDVSKSVACGESANMALLFLHITQKDVYLVFRSLCKLSMKPLSAGQFDSKSYELSSKLLSLKLLLSLVQNPGSVFKSSDVFIRSIKQYLCVTLSKNGVSSVTDVFELSLAIFLSLLSHFKKHLKMQIEVFFKEIILYLLESPSSSFDHKWIILQTLTRICSNAQCVVDIFLNYDCDLALSNVFERLVDNLAKLAQGRQALELGCTYPQERQLRGKSLECLVSIVKCMVEWSRDLYVAPQSQPNPAAEHCRGSLNAAVGSSLETVASRDSWQSLNSNAELPAENSASAECHNADNPEQFETQKEQKDLYEMGIEIFNKKPFKGIGFLQSHSLLGSTVEDVAEFFFIEPRLDKTAIGDFLGEPDKYNSKVMHSYVDLFDLGGDFVSALRKFLEAFRLPGEAQKIDRLMEKFASHYCECNAHNEGVFASADAAYVLAFSIIMLTTDLHSPQIKATKKMTKEQYISMNRGVNDSSDLPKHFLSKVYDEIAARAIQIKDDVRWSATKQGSITNEKQRKLIFCKETETMARNAKALMESVCFDTSAFTSATHQEHVRPMFKTAWTPLLAAFSVGLQNSDDASVASLCLEGIQHAIRIACTFHMDLERDAYCQALCRFTLLTAALPVMEMKAKNIDTIKALMSVAHCHGNYLGGCWLDVLRCISHLELAQLIGSGVKYCQAAEASHVATDQKKKKKRDLLQEQVGETSSQSVVVAVDRIFMGSVRLDGDAIVQFTRALCQVSDIELSLPKPRMFSLQKIVEISYYNMDRIRLQWSRIWQVVGDHFDRAGSSSNEEIAFFSVDSLRQLSMKFIEKGEFVGFQFQKEFLRPFETIMRQTKLPQVRDLVVQCVAQMIKCQAANIRSGLEECFQCVLFGRHGRRTRHS